ncbi:MAG: efflux RND transporter periplasmic adaptor subunit [bacterium]|nr:efflux RND transporter periplasmic adaptor subunit [bacterium]
MFTRNCRTALTLILALALAGCGKKKADEEIKVPVQVDAVRKGDVVQSLSYTGEIQAENEVQVFAKVPDRIERYFVDIGSRVAAGAPVAKIYAATLEQAVRQAEAGLAAAKSQEANMAAEFVRAERLYKENAMSKQQYDAVRTQSEAAAAQARQAEAGLASIRDQFEETTVKAPISGLVGERNYDEGDMANPAMPLVRIVQMERVKIVFQAAEQDLGRLAAGQEAEIRVKSYPDRVFKGRIRKVSPVLDPMTRMARVEVLAPNPGLVLKPGMFAEIEVRTGVLKNALTVPRYAAIENTSMETRGGRDIVVKKYIVFSVDSGKAVQRPIEVDYVNHENIAVRSGLRAGDTIVVSGQNNLRDGMAVAAVR